MKLFIALALATVSTLPVLAQRVELSVQLHTGLFSFDGKSPGTYSFVNVNEDVDPKMYTNNPYGTKGSFSYGANVQAKLVTKGKWLVGARVGYESLASKIQINGASGPISWNATGGESIFTHTFLTVEPFFGKRFNLGVIKTDITLGVDLAKCLTASEAIDVDTNQGEHFSGTYDRSKPDLDVRPHLEATVWIKRFGISVGYAYGLTNYTELTGANRESYARYAKAGVSYRIF